MEDEQRLTEAMENIGVALHRLGTNHASESLGAIELLAMEVKEGSTRVSEALHDIADAIRDSDTAPTG